MRETTWITESEVCIKGLWSQLYGDEKVGCVEFSIQRIFNVNLRVYSTSELYLRYLADNFPPAIADPATQWMTLYYDRNDLGKVETLRPGINWSDLRTPCVGFFDPGTNTALITGLDEYGLLTSTIIGMYSRPLFYDGWSPIHGAAIDVEKTGALLIGYHGAGKSTALLNLIHQTKSRVCIKVLTDDWSLARLTGDGIKLRAVEGKMSFSHSLVKENPELGLVSFYEENVVDGIGKLWVDIDEVMGAGTCERETSLRKVLIFSPDESTQLIEPISIEEVADLLVDSAYHMPDNGPGIKAQQISFWMEALKTIDFVKVNSRKSRRPKSQIYNEILDFIIQP